MTANSGAARAKSIQCQRCGAPGTVLCVDCVAVAREQEKSAIVGRGICPQCGKNLIPNMELAGYWTCGTALDNTSICDYEIILDC